MYSHYTITAPALHLKSFHTHPNFYLSEQYKSPEDTFFHLPDHYFTLLIFCFLNRSKTVVPHQSYCTDLPQFIAVIALKHFHAAVLPWQMKSTFFIFSVSFLNDRFSVYCTTTPASFARSIHLSGKVKLFVLSYHS